MSGRIFRLGDDVDTDALAPGRWMSAPIGELATHCLEAIRPDFATAVRPGDVIVAGRNFGMGSSREQAAEALRHLGLAGVVALSFAGIFHRNALNLGLPVLVAHDGLEAACEGDAALLDLDAAQLRLTDKGLSVPLEPLPDFLRAMLADGGLIGHLKQRFAAERAAGGRPT